MLATAPSASATRDHGSAGAAAGGATTGAAGNCYINSAGMLSKSTSTRRDKEQITEVKTPITKLLALEPHEAYRKEDVGRLDRRLTLCFIAEEAHELGLTHLVDYDEEDQPSGFYYDNWTAALQHIARYHNDEIETLKSTVSDQAKMIHDLQVAVAALQKG